MNKFLLLLILAISGCSDSSTPNDSETTNSNEINNQHDLAAYLNECRYESIESYVGGEICNENEQGDYDCHLIYNKWSLSFFETELHWHTTDQIDVTTYTYVDPNEFLINLGHTSIIATIDTSAKKIETEGVIYELVPAE